MATLPMQPKVLTDCCDFGRSWIARSSTQSNRRGSYLCCLRIHKTNRCVDSSVALLGIPGGEPQVAGEAEIGKQAGGTWLVALHRASCIRDFPAAKWFTPVAQERGGVGHSQAFGKC